MPNVMIRKNEKGDLTLYVAKKDLEDTIVSVEKDTVEEWGGVVKTADGTAYYLKPVEGGLPKLPITLRATRAEG